MLADTCPQKRLAFDASELLGKDRFSEAAELVAKASGQPKREMTKDRANLLLGSLLHWLLNNDGMEEAAMLLWGPTQFDPRPESTRRVWETFDKYNNILLMGAGSQSKSFSMAIKLFLEWLRDPENTTVKVLGPSEQHLEDNLFTHLVQLHQGSRIPLPGEIGKLFIGLDHRARKSSISGVVIPIGKKASGRLQGVKRSPRKTPHPIFGTQSRLFVFLDEIANIPIGIWRDIDNLLSNTDGDGLKIIGAFNPTNQSDPVGTRCEPPFGWSSFDPDKHFDWVSTRGWAVVRLDAKYSENVRTGRVIYPGLQTLAGYNLVIKNAGGLDSPGYWAMARGCFPPTGAVMSVLPPGLLLKWRADVIWYEAPKPCGGVDLALEGGDSTKFAKGMFGLASAIKLLPSLQHPKGDTVFFEDAAGRKRPRYVLLVEQIFTLSKGESVAMSEEVMRVARAAGISPEWLAVDSTGNGAGVSDLLKYNFGPITSINFFQGASETKIMAEDAGTAYEFYERANSEMAFALRKFVEFGYCYASPSLSMEELGPQLSNRLFRLTGKKARVESKPEFKTRNANKSPDEADAVGLLLAVVRKASGFVPGMTAENSTEPLDDDDDGGGYGAGYTDQTNRFEDL